MGRIVIAVLILLFGGGLAQGSQSPLDVDANGEVDALTDGLLVLRYLFGFRDAALTAGALAPDCTRCGANEIEAYLDGFVAQFDVDGNGEVDALTDGLLLLRYLFGFRGDALTAGALAPDCTRCDAESIEEWIEESSGTPTVVISGHTLRNFSVDDAGLSIVALSIHSGENDRSRHLLFTQFDGAEWSTPIVVADNASFSFDTFQPLPQITHPRISGNGNTIVYAGYSSLHDTFLPYAIDRNPDDSWGVPYIVTTEPANTHYIVSISNDGDTVAFCNYPFIGIQYVYTIERTGGFWGTPSTTHGDVDWMGRYPSLSGDGDRLIFVSDIQIRYSERGVDGWSTPVQITNHPGLADGGDYSYLPEYPRLTSDGGSLFYWLITRTSDPGGGLTSLGQDLYVMTHEQGDWTEAVKINGELLLKSHLTDSLPAIDGNGTRAVYPRPTLFEDVIHGSQLKYAEKQDGDWSVPTILIDNVSGSGYNLYPEFSADGGYLFYVEHPLYVVTNVLYRKRVF